jgi:VWFA-related protein
MTRLVHTALALAACAWVGVADTSYAAAQQGAPQPATALPPATSIAIAEPLATDYVVGPTTLRAVVEPPESAVQRVDFFVDGVRVCQAEQRPFACSWDAGGTVRRRLVRAVAVLPSSERLATSVRTSEVPGFTDSGGVDVVLVPFVVTDDDGRFVKGLRQADLSVREDNTPQTVTYFESEEVPLEIVVAIDISGSMEPVMPQLKESLKRFVGSFRANDRVTLVAFNHQVYVLQRRTADRAALAASIDQFSPSGGTALYDAVLTSLTLFGSEVHRRAVIVFTDGEDQGSLTTAAPVQRRLQASDAVAYFITLEGETRTPEGRRSVASLAEVSGGKAFSIGRIGQLEGALATVRDELQNQYLVGYTPGNAARDGSYRQIQVSTTDRRHKVRARQGYRAEER